MKKHLLLWLVILTITQSIKAQEGFEKVLLSGTEDSKAILEGYFQPAMEGFIYSMNNGWTHTAKVHKVLGFDLTIGASGAMVPSSKEMFKVSGLTNINQSNGGIYEGPTLISDQSEGNPLIISKDGYEIPIDMPGGITEDLPINAVPSPTLQLNVSLPFKTEVMLRYFPETEFGEDGGNAQLLGIGLKKEITSLLGPLKRLPLHVSLLASYTTLNVNYGFEDASSTYLTTEDASAEFDLTSFNVQILASLNFPFINFYGGFGYGKGESNFNMTGKYIYDKNGANEENLIPPSLNFSAASVKTTIGTRLSLGFFKIFADYTIQEYNTASAGIAFSFR